MRKGAKSRSPILSHIMCFLTVSIQFGQRNKQWIRKLGAYSPSALPFHTISHHRTDTPPPLVQPTARIWCASRFSTRAVDTAAGHVVFPARYQAAPGGRETAGDAKDALCKMLRAGYGHARCG